MQPECLNCFGKGYAVDPVLFRKEQCLPCVKSQAEESDTRAEPSQKAQDNQSGQGN